MNEENHKKIFQNPDVLKWIIVGLVGFIAIILIFSVGMQVGSAKARFSYKWADNYHKNFAGPRGGFLGDWRKFPAGDFISGHGAFGEVIEVSDSSFVIKGRGDIEQVIIISINNTVVKQGRTNFNFKDGFKNSVKVGDRVTIIGSPNDEGQIEAKFIRIFNEERISPVFHN